MSVIFSGTEFQGCRITRIECKDLAGKIVRSITLFEERSDGPEIFVDFEDGSNFNACLGVKMTVEAKWARDDGEHQIGRRASERGI
jgi:hypothetical protein